LIEDHRNGEEEARIKRQLEEREKGLRNRKSDQVLMKRGFEIAKQGPGEGIEEGTHEDHDSNHPKKTFSQLSQSLKNSFSIHLSLVRV
jgi:hypothetical protein